MVEKVIRFLITLAVIVGLVWLCFWVFGMLGIAIPGMIRNVIWVIAVLLILLFAWRTFRGDVSL